jgi:hypothetical protein
VDSTLPPDYLFWLEFLENWKSLPTIRLDFKAPSNFEASVTFGLLVCPWNAQTRMCVQFQQSTFLNCPLNASHTCYQLNISLLCPLFKGHLNCLLNKETTSQEFAEESNSNRYLVKCETLNPTSLHIQSVIHTLNLSNSLIAQCPQRPCGTLGAVEVF